MEGVLEAADRGAHERLGHRSTDVVDHHVDPAELGDGRGGERLQTLEIGHVRREHEGPAPEGLDVGRHAGELLLGPGGDGDVGTGLGEGTRAAGADPASRARDEGDLVRECEAVEQHGGEPSGPAIRVSRRRDRAVSRAWHDGEVTPAEPTTVLDAVNLLEREGFGAGFVLRGSSLRCSACGNGHEVAGADVVRVYRFEGPSDPDEEAVVYALRCPVCGIGGTLVSGFGPSADPEVTDRLVMLDERFRPTT